MQGNKSWVRSCRAMGIAKIDFEGKASKSKMSGTTKKKEDEMRILRGKKNEKIKCLTFS